MRVSLLLPGHDSALSIELGKVKWVKGYEFGVEFVRMPLESRQRLNNRLRTELIEWLQIRRQTGEWPDRLRSTD
ncbi:MAG: hypothetical protein UZ03_NOB001000169 [Nitrospira sp. OLB3]|nr:MAG: hypothetical protein UZ03_NOB001000169 [Nitrospira sp. OLB3]